MNAKLEPVRDGTRSNGEHATRAGAQESEGCYNEVRVPLRTARPVFLVTVRPMKHSPVWDAGQLKHDLKRYKREGVLMLECIDVREAAADSNADASDGTGLGLDTSEPMTRENANGEDSEASEIIAQGTGKSQKSMRVKNCHRSSKF